MTGGPSGQRPLGLISVAIGAAISVSVMDGIMIVVALPFMARDLNVSASSAILVVSAYQLAIAMLILPMSAISAALGLKRAYLTCIALLGVASACCAFAPSLPVLITARIVQGIGGAGIMALTNALLRQLYPANRLTHALGINVAVAAIALSAGPSIAAFLLSALSWHWLFLVNVPVALFALFAGMLWLGDGQSHARQLGGPGILLSMWATGASVLALNLLAQGAAPGWAVLAAAIAVAGWTSFALQQRRSPRPLLGTSLLRTRAIWPSLLVYLLAAFAQTAAYISIPFMLNAAGYKPAQIGLYFSAWPIAILVIGPVAARLCRRHSFGKLAAMGIFVMALGLAGLALMTEPSPARVVGFIAFSGLGYGFYQIPNTQALVSVVSVSHTADVTAMSALSRSLGQATGAAAVALALRLQGAQATSWVLALSSILLMLAGLASWARVGGGRKAVVMVLG